VVHVNDLHSDINDDMTTSRQPHITITNISSHHGVHEGRCHFLEYKCGCIYGALFLRLLDRIRQMLANFIDLNIVFVFTVRQPNQHLSETLFFVYCTLKPAALTAVFVFRGMDSHVYYY